MLTALSRLQSLITFSVLGLYWSLNSWILSVTFLGLCYWVSLYPLVNVPKSFPYVRSPWVIPSLPVASSNTCLFMCPKFFLSSFFPELSAPTSPHVGMSCTCLGRLISPHEACVSHIDGFSVSETVVLAVAASFPPLPVFIRVPETPLQLSRGFVNMVLIERSADRPATLWCPTSSAVKPPNWSSRPHSLPVSSIF